VFDLFSTSHLLLIAIAILVFIGPKDLPRFMLASGKWVRKIRGMAAEFRSGIEDLGRQAELDDLRKELEALRSERVPAAEPSPAARQTRTVAEVQP
jgi:sec-independent protein translocase protein TatB